MKLRNKKTGEIGYFCFANWNDPVLIIMDKNGSQLAKYHSLAELNEEWEDYKEPMEIYYINYKGHIMSASSDGNWDDEKEIGNYFETKEEAEKAVEKLKTWKRLKDNKFRFTGYEDNTNPKGNSYQIIIKAIFDGVSFDDLDLLFGGEE